MGKQSTKVGKEAEKEGPRKGGKGRKAWKNKVPRCNVVGEGLIVVFSLNDQWGLIFMKKNVYNVILSHTLFICTFVKLVDRPKITVFLDQSKLKLEAMSLSDNRRKYFLSFTAIINLKNVQTLIYKIQQVK